MKNFTKLLLPAIALAAVSCDSGNHDIFVPSSLSGLDLSDMARIISELPMDLEHLEEVHDAVSSSSGNGYDEEYMMSDLLSVPGAGVGDDRRGTKAASYGRPLRDLLSDYLATHVTTKSGEDDVQEYLDGLSASDIQIYWPYSEDWDGETFPIVTFDPGMGAESNYGYELHRNGDRLEVVGKVIVTEKTAKERPVWVINRNSDSEFTPLELFESSFEESASEDPVPLFGDSGQEGRVMLLRSFKARKNFDSWFGGASEFFIKCGAVDGFRATTDEELKLYSPSVTDFLIVVKRSQVGYSIPLNTVLLTDFTPQMEKIAFAIMEDDGGESTSWKCEAVVKYKSRSYGFTMDIPYRDKDDIVWRGQLSSEYLSSRRFVSDRFGETELTFELR